jgi:peroxiredoxin Q/BCP
MAAPTGPQGTSRYHLAVIEEGKAAPDFELGDDTGRCVKLSSLRGSPVVLYFYPKDDTPGCTKQACGIRDAWDAFAERGAVVLGVSPDDEASHAAFKEKFDLPFTLLSDPDHEVADAYGVWTELDIAGNRFMGNERSTFVIGADGVVNRVMRKVDPASHTSDVLDALPS